MHFLKGESDRVQNNNPKIQINRMGQRPNKQAVGWKNDLPVNSALFSKRINIILYGKRCDWIKDLQMRSLPWIIGWALHVITRTLIRQRQREIREREKETERRRQCKDRGRAWCDPKMRNAGSHQKTEEARNRFSPTRAFRGSATMSPPWFQASGLLNCENKLYF